MVGVVASCSASARRSIHPLRLLGRTDLSPGNWCNAVYLPYFRQDFGLKGFRWFCSVAESQGSIVAADKYIPGEWFCDRAPPAFRSRMHKADTLMAAGAPGVASAK